MSSFEERHVQYILLAEFDIDKGASLKHQYPNETGTDEHILSELMLPDGAHLRAEDWTIFCLNQLTPDPDQVVIPENKHEIEQKPLLYVLNLVRTKHDATARRGARVKAMAICTRHQYLHIYKPVLLLAMEKYFESPSSHILESLYEAVNSMDLTNMPNFTWHERQILRASDNKTIFEEMFVEEPTTMENINIMEDTYDSKIRRETYIDLASGEKIPALSKDRHFFETKIEYDGIKLPIKIPLTVNAEEVGDFSIIKLINAFPANNKDHSVSSNPRHPHLDNSGAHAHPIMLLLNALLTQKRIVFLGYGHPSGEVANYVLAACALGSGCGTVLRGFTERAFPYTNLTSVDDLLKCPGFIAGVTNPTYEEHTAWWDVLCNISTGKITVSKDIESSYAVSSSKLNFATQSRKQSIISPSISTNEDPSSPVTSFNTLSLGRSSSMASNQYKQSQNHNDKHSGAEDKKDTDAEFMNDVLVSIQKHYGETSIRAKFQDYILRFVRLAAIYEEQVYGHTKIGWNEENPILDYGPVFQDEASKRRELEAHESRIEGWRETISYKYYQRDWINWWQNCNIKNIDVYRQISKLKKLKYLQDNEAAAIYDAFLSNILTHRQVIEFLSYLPQHQGGLSPLGIGLFHSNSNVRKQTVNLFRRLERSPVGIKFVQDLPRFQRIAYERQAVSIVAKE